MKILKFFSKKNLIKKRVIWPVIILLVVLTLGYFAFFKNKGDGNIQTAVVSKQNLEETVLATGQVVSKTNLNLSFQGSGIVRQVLVKEGDKVASGQLLAAIDQASARASLTSAQGSLEQAQASYDKLVNGATPEDIKVIENDVASARENLNSAYNGALNTLNDAYAKIYTSYTTAYLISTTYFAVSDQEGIKVRDNRTNINNKMADVKSVIASAAGNEKIDLAISAILIDLNDILNSLKIIRDMCDEGVYYFRVSAADKSSLDSRRDDIISAITSVNSLKHNIASYKIALDKTESQLSLKQAKPRQEDIDLAKAQILSAQGQVDAARATVNNLTLFTPSAGTITQVDIKVGEQATSMAEVMVLQDIGNLHTEANVSEANIASLEAGQKIDYTFDALGPDRHFEGSILTINPSSTVISGVVNYKVTGSLDNIPDIKPGMTANMSVLVAKKDNVLAVPSSAVINKNSKQYVRVIDDFKNKTYHEVQVKTGLQADGGLVEIISGLEDGQEIITYLKP
ncbi:MAG: efflux RND transporter periplasmic adaptor subunit [Patescibacteria group bacterium]